MRTTTASPTCSRTARGITGCRFLGYSGRGGAGSRPGSFRVRAWAWAGSGSGPLGSGPRPFGGRAGFPRVAFTRMSCVAMTSFSALPAILCCNDVAMAVPKQRYCSTGFFPGLLNDGIATQDEPLQMIGVQWGLPGTDYGGFRGIRHPVAPFPERP